MKTGRPAEFDRSAALEKAMNLFWRHGYEATSLADLLREMGIGRQSLYNAFGDKHSLFLEAAKHYGDRTMQRLLDSLTSPGSGLQNIRKTFAKIASHANGADCRGCLMTNSIVELAPHDEEVAKIVRANEKRINDAFKSALELAVEAGEIAADTDSRAMARFLTGAMHGIVVVGKTAPSKAVIADIVKITLSKL